MTHTYRFVCLFHIFFFVCFIVRCKVPECEVDNNNRGLPFNQPWLNNAIPTKNGKLSNCLRYAPRNLTTNLNGPEQCSADMFDTSVEIACTEFVYSSNERNLQTEVLNQVFVFFRCAFIYWMCACLCLRGIWCHTVCKCTQTFVYSDSFYDDNVDSVSFAKVKYIQA